MSDEHQEHNESRVAKSGIAKLLLGKVLSHKLFSDQVLFWIILGVSFLLPVFFVPGQLVAPEFAKMILLEVLVLLGVFVWAMGRLRDGHVDIPKSLLLMTASLLVVQFVVAAIVSPTPMLSFIGSGYDIGTVNSFVVLFLLMFLGSIVLIDRDRILMLYASFLLAGFILMVYHLLRHFFGADFLSFGIFTGDVLTPIGKWNDLASMVGAIVLLVLSTLYFFPTNKSLRLPSYLILAAGLFFLLIVNFTVLWFVLFVLMGVIVALAVYEGEQTHKRTKHEVESSGGHHPHKPVHKRVAGHLPFVAVIFMIISIVYGSGISTIPWGKDNTTITSLVGGALHAAPYSEVVLTPSYTFGLVSDTLKDSPLFGTGPNRFATSYLLYKTTDMNRTPFWDATFDYGLGRIPTYFGTTGAIGTLLWIAFIVLLLAKGRKIFALFAKDRIAAYLAFTLFLFVLYFWSIAFLYLPNIAIFALAFLFTGALIAFLVGEGVLGRYHVKFDSGSKLSLVVTPVAIIVLVGVVASGMLLYRQVSSLVAFRDAQLAIGQGDIAGAENALARANALSERDIYQRSVSNLGLIKLQQLAGQKLPQEEVAAKANAFINQSRTSAERAVTLDPTNFENYLQLGGVYDTLGSLGIQNTAEPARQNYQQALLLNPKSPRVLFVLARLEFAASNRAKAKEYLYQALTERPNFLEAVSFLVQLELQDKNPDNALKILQNGVVAEPTNFLLRFALGYMVYTSGNFNDAIPQFEAAVFLNPVYADAKYFLGLSYAQVGRKSEAIQQFTDVQTLNPDNKDVATILKNLKASREPFDGGNPPPSQPVDDALKGLDSGSGSTKK